MVRRRDRAVVEVLVKWVHLPEEEPSWEEFHSFRRRFLGWNHEGTIHVNEGGIDTLITKMEQVK